MNALSPSIPPPEPVTISEKYLTALCRRTFLSLWSFSNLYRDQGRNNGIGSGKELCDLLVFFENNIIIFSDKYCAIPESGDVNKDWSRWYKKTISESANQVYGAERWIRNLPKFIFLDRQCKKPFPFEIPNNSIIKFHRIVVARGVKNRIINEIGGSGSLRINTDIIGEQHYLMTDVRHPQPFTIGIVDRRRYVHVFNDTTIELVLRSVDTISDFLGYLEKKEAFLLRGATITAAGEEELLGYYLSKVNDKSEHDFVFPKETKTINLGEGIYYQYQSSQGKKAQQKADEISYYWDRLIEEFAGHIAAGTDYHSFPEDISSKEKSIREMARETRLRRRLLSRALLDLITRSSIQKRSVRVVPPSKKGEYYYLFLLLPMERGVNPDKYRENRRNLLYAYCLSLKIKYPDASKIIGIATEAGMPDRVSNDAFLVDTTKWEESDYEEAKSLQKDFGLLTNMVNHHDVESEYPSEGTPDKNSPILERIRSTSRNKPCPCGSGKKYKICHGIKVRKTRKKRHMSSK